MSARVAKAGADYFEKATALAAEKAADLRRAFARETANIGEVKEQLLDARKSLAAAKEAYRKAEATVFFVDPESAEELRAQPDPLRAGSGSPAGRERELADLSSSLEKMDKLVSGGCDVAKAGALLAEARTVAGEIDGLEAGFRGLADAWKGNSPENFRKKFFLPSSEGAVARVFQGLLAMAGDLVPGTLASGTCDPAEISSRLRAVREIYLGDPGNEAIPVTLHQLVQEASPVQAALTRASVVRAVALAEVLEISADNPSLRMQLGAALDDLTRQLTFAAGTLGIEISIVEP